MKIKLLARFDRSPGKRSPGRRVKRGNSGMPRFPVATRTRVHEESERERERARLASTRFTRGQYIEQRARKPRSWRRPPTSRLYLHSRVAFATLYTLNRTIICIPSANTLDTLRKGRCSTLSLRNTFSLSRSIFFPDFSPSPFIGPHLYPSLSPSLGRFKRTTKREEREREGSEQWLWQNNRARLVY